MGACSCGSNDDVTLVYSCSGAANTGLLADQVMRTLNTQKVARSTCLAAVGANLSGFIQSGMSASKNVVLDGCKVSCGKKIFEKYGIPYQHFMMTDFGVEKGKTEINPQVIEKVATELTTRIQK